MTEESKLSILGADVSSLQRAEELGANYYHRNGTPGNALAILKDGGINFIRLRVWVAPLSGCLNKARVVEFARRVKAEGFGLLINLHYSDTWADPEHQSKPAAWAGHPLDRLRADVHDFTGEVCADLLAAGAVPEMIQIGNEINDGMLWPEGRISVSGFANLASFLKEGYHAVKAVSPSTRVMVHIANAADRDGMQHFFDGIRAEGVDWDLTGLSYYSYWHGTFQAMAETVGLARTRYGQPVIIAETAYPFTLREADDERNAVHSAQQLSPGYPATPAGQRRNLRAVLDTAEAAGAAGVFYWEPTWTAVPGNSWNPADPASGDQWENQALFDYKGRALPALDEFRR